MSSSASSSSPDKKNDDKINTTMSGKDGSGNEDDDKKNNNNNNKTKNEDDPVLQELRGKQMQVLQGLKRLESTLKDLNDKKSAPMLSHYRQLPAVVTQSYELLTNGASLVHGTSTKYTLLGKLSTAEQTRMTDDLLQGCQLLGSGCLVLMEDSSGCSRAVRHHVKQATRAIVLNVIHLMEAFLMDDPTTTSSSLVTDRDNTVGAQKTGAVWESCNMILEKRLPVGNRNAMRRELLTYKLECNETLQEFQDMIDAGPAETVQEEEKQQEEQQQEDTWDSFLQGMSDQYTEREMPIATACLHVIKLTRGCINATLQACEAVGAGLSSATATTTTSTNQQDAQSEPAVHDKLRLAWIAQLYEYAHDIGQAMTDLGATMYPPLKITNEVQPQVLQQLEGIEKLVQHIMDAPYFKEDDAPADLVELVTKLQAAHKTRKKQVMDAIATATASTTSTTVTEAAAAQKEENQNQE